MKIKQNVMLIRVEGSRKPCKMMMVGTMAGTMVGMMVGMMRMRVVAKTQA